VKNVFGTILDAVVPPRARSARTKARGIEDIPLEPTEHELLRCRIITLMDYRKEAVQDLVRSLKYDRSRHAAQLASMVLADYLREEVAAAHTFSTKRVLLVPVPLHRKRERERGFNQIALVLQALPSELRDGTEALLAPDVLVRTRATKQQTRLQRAERLSNVAGAFEATRDLPKTHVYLIDDVTTTGATLANAATPLKRAGAEVTLLALARA